jgi:hypothetical protein
VAPLAKAVIELRLVRCRRLREKEALQARRKERKLELQVQQQRALQAKQAAVVQRKTQVSGLSTCLLLTPAAICSVMLLTRRGTGQPTSVVPSLWHIRRLRGSTRSRARSLLTWFQRGLTPELHARRRRWQRGAA